MYKWLLLTSWRPLYIRWKSFEVVMSMNPDLGAALHLQQNLSNAALVKASAYSNTLPVFMLALYNRSATKGLQHNHLSQRNTKAIKHEMGVWCGSTRKKGTDAYLGVTLFFFCFFFLHQKKTGENFTLWKYVN